MKAVRKIRLHQGFPLFHLCHLVDRQTITRAIADQGRTIRVPVHMVDRIRQLYKRIHELEQNLGRSPTIDELALAMDTDKQKVSWMLRVSWLPLSLESPINDDEDESELGHFVEDKETPTPIQTVYSKLLKEKMNDVLDTLPCREARILKLRFGLEMASINSGRGGAEIRIDARTHPAVGDQSTAPPAPAAEIATIARLPAVILYNES
jgi:RNA polymerase primary sigma factor